MQLTADAVTETEAERVALTALRQASDRPGSPLERHSLRVFLIAVQLASEGTLRPDREVLLCAALLHDVGLYPAARTGDVYVRDSRRHADRVLAEVGWAADRLKTCLEAVEHHHRLRPQWHRGAEVELIRRADLVDGSGGICVHGLRRAWLRGLFHAVPRSGLYRELGRQGVPLLLRRPQTLPRIFAP